MIDKMSSVDFTENNICSGLSFTDIMEFNDSKAMKRFEDVICNLNFTSDLVKGTMIDPIMKMVSVKYRPHYVCVFLLVLPFDITFNRAHSGRIRQKIQPSCEQGISAYRPIMNVS